MSEQRRRRRIETDPYHAAPAPHASQHSHDARQETNTRRTDTPKPPPPHTPYRQPQQHTAPPAPPTIIVNQVNSMSPAAFGNQSHFDGGLLSLIGWSLLAGLICFFTLGIAYPFAACMLYRWEARHTVINGRRLYFDGTGWQLIGKWILWLLLTVITFGIYGFWLTIKLKQWRVCHTHFA